MKSRSRSNHINFIHDLSLIRLLRFGILYFNATQRIVTHSTFHYRNEPHWKEFLASIDPALVSACLVAFAGLCGVIIGIILVKMNTNRKMILLFSAFGTAVAFAILGCYYIFSESNPNSKYMEIKIAKLSPTLN